MSPSRTRVAVPNRRQLVTLAEAARLAGISTKTVRRRIADGTLSGYRMGPRLIRVDLAEFDALLKPMPNARGDAS